MAIDKINSEGLLLSDDFVFTGSVTGAGGVNTPAFEARNGEQYVTDEVWTKVNYTSEIFDSDGKYDTTNKRFTPTVAGKYHITAWLIFDAQGIDRFHAAQLSIYKNGSQHQGYVEDTFYDNYYAYSQTPFIATNIDLDADDYVEIYAKFNLTTGTPRLNSNGFFGAFKIIT